jgi:hypothetical protein
VVAARQAQLAPDGGEPIGQRFEFAVSQRGSAAHDGRALRRGSGVLPQIQGRWCC